MYLRLCTYFKQYKHNNSINNSTSNQNVTVFVIVGLVLHQRVIGQNGMNKMVWTEWYGQNGTDRMVRTEWYGQNGTDRMVRTK